MLHLSIVLPLRKDTVLERDNAGRSGNDRLPGLHSGRRSMLGLQGWPTLHRYHLRLKPHQCKTVSISAHVQNRSKAGNVGIVSKEKVKLKRGSLFQQWKNRFQAKFMKEREAT